MYRRLREFQMWLDHVRATRSWLLFAILVFVALIVTSPWARAYDYVHTVNTVVNTDIDTRGFVPYLRNTFPTVNIDEGSSYTELWRNYIACGDDTVTNSLVYGDINPVWSLSGTPPETDTLTQTDANNPSYSLANAVQGTNAWHTICTNAVGSLDVTRANWTVNDTSGGAVGPEVIPEGSGRNFFIRNAPSDVGNDNLGGTTEATAWRNCSKVVNFLNTAVTTDANDLTKPRLGDKFWFKGGSTFAESCSFNIIGGVDEDHPMIMGSYYRSGSLNYVNAPTNLAPETWPTDYTYTVARPIFTGAYLESCRNTLGYHKISALKCAWDTAFLPTQGNYPGGPAAVPANAFQQLILFDVKTNGAYFIAQDWDQRGSAGTGVVLTGSPATAGTKCINQDPSCKVYSTVRRFKVWKNAVNGLTVTSASYYTIQGNEIMEASWAQADGQSGVVGDQWAYVLPIDTVVGTFSDGEQLSFTNPTGKAFLHKKTQSGSTGFIAIPDQGMISGAYPTDNTNVVGLTSGATAKLNIPGGYPAATNPAANCTAANSFCYGSINLRTIRGGPGLGIGTNCAFCYGLIEGNDVHDVWNEAISAYGNSHILIVGNRSGKMHFSSGASAFIVQESNLGASTQDPIDPKAQPVGQESSWPHRPPFWGISGEYDNGPSQTQFVFDLSGSGLSAGAGTVNRNNLMASYTAHAGTAGYAEASCINQVESVNGLNAPASIYGYFVGNTCIGTETLSFNFQSPHFNTTKKINVKNNMFLFNGTGNSKCNMSISTRTKNGVACTVGQPNCLVVTGGGGLQTSVQRDMDYNFWTTSPGNLSGCDLGAHDKTGSNNGLVVREWHDNRWGTASFPDAEDFRPSATGAGAGTGIAMPTDSLSIMESTAGWTWVLGKRYWKPECADGGAIPSATEFFKPLTYDYCYKTRTTMTMGALNAAP